MSPCSAEMLENVGIALAHSVWQIALVAIGVRCLLQATSSATCRYRLAFSGLCLVLALLVATGVLVSTSPVWRDLALFRQQSETVVDSVPKLRQLSTQSSYTFNPVAAAVRVQPLAVEPYARTAVVPMAHFNAWSTLAVAWFAGAVIMVGMSGLRVHRAYHIRRQALDEVPAWIATLCHRLSATLGIRSVEVAISARVLVPTLIGLLKPMILLPPSVLGQVSPAHLELIITHELAHVRRYDFAVNLVQSFIESLLFYHPCVWWLSRRIREEREYCADDFVLTASTRRDDYVSALLSIESCRQEPIPAVAAGGGSLVKRVRRIAAAETVNRRQVTWSSAGMGIAMAAIMLLLISMPAIKSAMGNDEDEPKRSTLVEEAEMSSENVGRRWQTAIESGDLDAIRELLNHPWGNIRTQCLQKFRDDGTWFLLDPLSAAARQGSVPIAELLIESGTPVNQTNGILSHNGLVDEAHCLAWASSDEMREFLISKGANPQSIEGLSIPHLNEVNVAEEMTTNNLGEQWQAALMALDVERVRVLLSDYPHLVDQPLLGTAGDGRFWRCDALYSVAQADATISIISWTKAQAPNKLAIVKLLMQAGYDQDRARHALREASTDIATYLLEELGEGEPDMGLLAYSGQADELQFWIDRGQPLSSDALHNATCGRGRYRGYDTDDHTGWPEPYRETVRVLLAAGADVHARNAGGGAGYDGCRPYQTFGETPLHFAAASWDTDVIQQLLDANADKAAENENGETPYDFAVAWEAPEETLQLLRTDPHSDLGQQALVTGQALGSTSVGTARLIEAIRGEDVASVRRLLGDDPALANAEIPFDATGLRQTPLHRVMPGDGREMRVAHLEIARALLEHGAEVDRLGEGPNLGHCTPLTVAAWGGHADLVRLLIEHGADVAGGEDETPNHPLSAAAGHGHAAAVEVLLDGGASAELDDLVMAGLEERVVKRLNANPELVSQKNAQGSTLLHAALETGAGKALLPLLLERGGDVSQRDAEGRTVLQLAIERSLWWPQADTIAMLRRHDDSRDVFTAAGLGDAQLVAELLADHRALAKEAQADGTTALFHAVVDGNIECARLLLDAGADPSPQSDRFWCSLTPLHLSIQQKRDDITRLLVDRGADLDAHGDCEVRWQPTPLHMAARWGGAAMMELLLDAGADMYAGGSGSAMEWVVPGEVELAKLMLRHGFDLKRPEAAGLLHKAAVGGDEPMVQLLLEHGANPTAKNDAGHTAQQLAMANGHMGVARMLGKEVPDAARREISKPATVPDESWQLFEAAAAGDLAKVRTLIKRDPKSIHYQLWYEFPLHNAVRAGHAEVVKELLKAGSNPARSNFTYSSWQVLLPLAKDRGFEEVHRLLVEVMQERFNYSPHYKPLWEAIGQNHIEAVRQLIKDSPRLVNIGDEHGNRALHWAVLCRRIPMIELLLDAGADINAKRADMRSPLYMSIEGDYWFGKSDQADPETTNRQVTDYLLSKGAEYEFSVAVNRNDLEQVKSEVGKHPALACELDVAQRNPLSHAVGDGKLELMRFLLEQGNDPNQSEHCAGRGKALFLASSNHDLEMMRLLLEYGADPNGYVDSSGNCLSIADYESGKRDEALALLREYGANEGVWNFTTPEAIAARLADESAFDPDTGIWDGMLRQIFDTDRVDLLDRYVDRFGTESVRRMNPTNGWRIPKSRAMFERLLDHGLNINARDWYGRTFLHHVAYGTDLEMATLLLDQGIDIDAIDLQSGTTALGLAAWAGQLEMVKLLLNRGADQMLPLDAEWARPASFAEQEGHADIVRLLKQES